MAADVQQHLQELREIELDIAADIHALEQGEVLLEDLSEHLRSVRALINEGSRVLQNARSIVDDLELAQSRKDLRERLTQEKQEMESMIPAALHAAKAKFAASERDSLLSGAQDQHSKIQSEQQRLKQSTQITDSLQRTRSMMSREITRGNEAYQLLKSQGVQLDGLNDMHVEYGAKVSVGRRLITLISRKEMLEKIIVFISFGWFLAVVLYIVYVRLMPASTSTRGLTEARGFASHGDNHAHLVVPEEL